MKQPLDEHRYFYVDETGDPSFYAKGKKLIVGQEGCSRTFGLGFLRTADPETIRQALLELPCQRRLSGGPEGSVWGLGQAGLFRPGDRCSQAGANLHQPAQTIPRSLL